MTDDLDRARPFIAKARWVFAKSVPQHPHEYSLRRWLEPALQADFDAFAALIAERGYRGPYWGATERGIQVALLIVDAGIEPLTGKREGVDPAALADPYEIAQAVRSLGEQGPRAATHELQLTPLAERWVP